MKKNLDKYQNYHNVHKQQQLQQRHLQQRNLLQQRQKQQIWQCQNNNKKRKQKQQILNCINSLEVTDLSKLAKSKRKTQEQVSKSEEVKDSAESEVEPTPPPKKF